MAGWTDSTGSSGGRGSGGRGFTTARYTTNSTNDMVHGGTSGGGGGSGRWRGGRSRGWPPPQPHHRYRRVDAVHRDSPPVSLSELQAASSTSSRHRYLTRSISADKSSASGTAGLTDTREPDDKANRSAANFECNVCFDMAAEPVVTRCGHLFCWECLYQWLHIHSHHRECPVCKGQVADDAIIPIYGRGGSAASVDNAPPRPTGARVESTRQQQQQQLPIFHPPNVFEFIGLGFAAAARGEHSTEQLLLPTFSHPTVFDDDDGHEWDMDLVNNGIDPLDLITPGTQDLDMDDYDGTIDFDDDDYEYDYHLAGATMFASAGTEASNPSSSQAHAGMINIRDNILGTATSIYHQQEFGYSGVRPHNNRGRRRHRNRARASANHSGADETVIEDTSHFYLQNGGSSNFSAGAAFRPNGGWTGRRGRSNLNSNSGGGSNLNSNSGGGSNMNSNSGGGRGGIQGTRRQRTNYN